MQSRFAAGLGEVIKQRRGTMSRPTAGNLLPVTKTSGTALSANRQSRQDELSVLAVKAVQHSET